MKDSLTRSLSLTVTIIIRTPRPRLWAWPFSAMCGCIAGVQQGERSMWSSEKSAEHRVQGYGRRTPSARPSVCNVGLGTCGARGMQAYGVHGCSVEGIKRRVTSVGRWARGCRGRRMLCTRLGEDREGLQNGRGGLRCLEAEPSLPRVCRRGWVLRQALLRATYHRQRARGVH